MHWMQPALETIDPRATFSDAIRRDDGRTIRTLLGEYEALLEAPDVHGIRPLYEAVLARSADAVGVLVERGAKLHAPQAFIDPLAPSSAWAVAMIGPNWPPVEAIVNAHGLAPDALLQCARDLEEHKTPLARAYVRQVRTRLRGDGEGRSHGGATRSAEPASGPPTLGTQAHGRLRLRPGRETRAEG